MSVANISKLRAAFASLRRDLMGREGSAEGPRISTMRNYRFAILQYDPTHELPLRAEVQRLTSELAAHGWMVLSIDLQRLFFDRIRAKGDGWIQRVVDAERRTALASSEHGAVRGLNYLATKLAPLIEGPDGLAADCSRRIIDHVERHPDEEDITLALIGRAGALYPFFRSSALLRHLDGRTRNVPVVLLYPGEKHTATGLSFMGQLAPDSDYRPRIYSA